jgi:two-component system CheB/CheR fusion protein
MPKESNTLFFASLKQEILPAIIENARGHDRTLRFWSAGCYTGEEPYALAMILADLLGSDLNQFQIKIFATDNDRAALTIAREAYYDAKILSDLPEKYTTRFFEQNERGYRVMRAIRELIIFGMHDLEHDVPFSDIDVLMCRHHLPSFSPEQPEQQHPLFSRFAFALAPRKGYLLLGHKCDIQLSSSLFERVSSEEPIYRCLRRGEINRLHREQENHPVRAFLEQTIRNRQTDDLPRSRFRQFSSLGFSDAVIGSAPFGIIVIDQSYRMLSWNRAAEKVLMLSVIETGQDFFHTVYGLPYAQMRTAIDSIFEEGGSLTIAPVELALSAGGNGRVFSITSTLLPAEVGNAQHMALYFNNITEQTLFKQANLKQAQFLENLTSANTYLAAENTDLVDANQQLRDASQAMLTCYEQLQEQIIQEQLIIEEMTTVQEELQATLDARELILQELNQQDTEYSRRLSALQVIVDQQINQALAIYDIETSAPLISSLAFREIVAAMHSKSPTDLVDLRWPQMFVTNSDKEARYAWQTALHNHQPQHFLSRKRVMTSNIQEQCWEWTLTPLLEKEEQARAHFVLATVIEQTEPMRHEQEPLR